MKTLVAADLFCGAGGSSTGLARTCAKLGYQLDLTAINHWTRAIESHSANHPDVRHICQSLDSINPKSLFPSGRLDLMWASPECLHFSVARGSRPISDQSRASAWHVLRWAESLWIGAILLENVREFADWGPLGANGRPINRRKGETFQAFITALRSLGYTVDWRVLNAADYGDPTTRQRLFIIARRGNRRIRWPEPTHRPSGPPTLFGEKPPWRAAREIIDWSLPGHSIFARKRPLAPASLARIATGLRRFGGPFADPFLCILRHHATARSLDEPLPTITGGGLHVGLVDPCLASHLANDHDTNGTDGDRPGRLEPFLLQQQSGGAPRSVADPVPTVCSAGAIALVEPFLIGTGGPAQAGQPRPVGRPLHTVIARNHMALVEPFLIPFFGERENQGPRTHSLDAPLPTVTSHGAGGLVEPFLVKYHGNHQGKHDGTHRVRPTTLPLATLDTSNRMALVEPFLVRYNKRGPGAHSVSEPVGTITTKDRFGLVTVDGTTYTLDIRFRMLQPHELSAAMGFPGGYQFAGTQADQVRQIGNAVPVHTAEALCLAILSG